MKKSLLAIAAIIVIGAVSVFALSPYFTESSVDEALPAGAIIQPKMEDKEATTMMMDKEEEEEDKMMMDKEEEEEDKMMMDKEEEEEEDKMMMDKEEEEDKMMMDKEEEEEEDKMMMDKEEEEEEEDKMMMDKEEEEIKIMSYAGTFVGVGDGVHDAQGDAYTIPLEDGTNVLRLENFKSTNGPDLYVYLSTDKYASEFVNLGELKASSGNQNYGIPDDVDLGEYNQVLIWCKAFGVLFGNAELSSN